MLHWWSCFLAFHQEAVGAGVKERPAAILAFQPSSAVGL